MPESNLVISAKQGAPKRFQIIQFKGILDENTASAARSTLDQLVQGAVFSYLIFDLTELSYINSKGIGFLVSVHAHISKNNQKLVLVNPNESVNDVLTLVGVNTIMNCFASPEEAIQSLS
ncbi:STAS domain-containing protein [Candidatus Peregrinibacteria bacterium]|nr:STAS domain-containing protein [Candidatus Peregrinibacteria bacterium]